MSNGKRFIDRMEAAANAGDYRAWTREYQRAAREATMLCGELSDPRHVHFDDGVICFVRGDAPDGVDVHWHGDMGRYASAGVGCFDEGLRSIVPIILSKFGNNVRHLFRELPAVERNLAGMFSLNTKQGRATLRNLEAAEPDHGTVQFWCDGCGDQLETEHWSNVRAGYLGRRLARQVIAYCKVEGVWPEVEQYARVLDGGQS